MRQSFLDGNVVLHPGDCLDVLKALPGNSVDSVVCDPPYELGFMGRKWDATGIANRVELWTEVRRVLKPGGHCLAFSATRTYHRMACAIEDAGFEIRDCIMWVYGSGFPKSHNLQGEWAGWGSALKPAVEPICVARKPLMGTIAENVLRHGTGALNIDGCRIETADVLQMGKTGLASEKFFTQGAVPYVEKSQHSLGRWPANLIHDGSDEVVGCFPESDVAPGGPNRGGMGYHGSDPQSRGRVDGSSGSAARFFYSSKADGDDRLGSKHPTVKPLDLMQYLVRLVTRKGGTVLDPFAGTGTTGEAAWREGCNAILIEREIEYQADIARRMELASNPTKRAAVAATKNNLDDPNTLPLFAGLDPQLNLMDAAE